MNTLVSIRRTSVLMLCSLTLTACFGGGSGGGGDADTTAPTITAATPASDATRVAPGAALSVTFSEAMDCTTLTTASFTLKDAGNNAVSGAVACSGSSVTFSPAPSLALSTGYTATVTTAAKDSAGNALAADHSWSFTTRGAYAVSGTVVGMNGTGVNTDLVLQLNGGNDLTLDESGVFTFPAVAIEDGTSYAVTVSAQPTTVNSQTCNVVNGSGTMADAAVTDVTVKCTPWTRQFGIAGVDLSVKGSATDADGNLYVVGYVSGNLHENVTWTTGDDYFLIKYDRYGKRVYTKQEGTGTAVLAYAVATDASGNVYVAGSTDAALTGAAQTGALDMFLVKYDSNGTRVYAKQLGVSAQFTSGNAIAVHGNGDVYVAGSTSGSLPGNAVAGATDFFVVKYSPDGTRGAIKQLGEAGVTANGNAVTVDPSGNIYVAGDTDGDLGGQTINNSAGRDMFLAKYDSAGNPPTVVLKGVSGSSETIARSIAHDTNGNIYVAGATSVGLDGNADPTGNWDVFLVKYAANGTRVYTEQLDAAGADTGGWASAVAVDANGNAYVAGNTTGGLDGNPITSAEDLFLAKYDASGTPLYTTQMGGAAATNTIGRAVSVGTDGALYVVGETNGGLDGNTVTGNTDGVVVKYDASGNKQ